MIYHNFAQLYDQLFEPDMYTQWRDFTESNIANDHKKILDLAGGSGRLAVLLAADGYDVTVADFSADMLALADQHGKEANVQLQLVETDMRDLSNLPQYDVITCYADSLCYLDNEEDIFQTLQEINAHLTPNGVFLCDLITPFKTDKVYPGYMYNYQDEDHQRAFMWQSFANDDVKHGVIHELTFFNRLANGQYERVAETHFERAYDIERLKDMFERAKFSSIEQGVNFSLNKLTPDADRWFFKCTK